MDEALRNLERAFAEEHSLATLRVLLSGLARSGRASDVLRLVSQHARDRVEELGATPVVDIEGRVRAFKFSGEATVSPERFHVRLRGWRLPSDLGGHHLLERRGDPAPALIHIGPAARFVVAHTMIGGLWCGVQTAVRLHAPDGSRFDLAEILHGDETTPDRAQEIEGALRRLAEDAGARVEVDPGGMAFWD